MKTRRIRNTILKYFICVLNDNNVKYEIEKKEGELFSYISTPLSSKAYHRYVERAMCLKQSAKCGGRNVISYNEWKDENFPKKAPYHILRKDQKRFLKEICYA